MRVVAVHEYYRLPGGEDEVFGREQCPLRSRGHDGSAYTREDREIDSYGLARQLTLPFRTISAPGSHRDLRALLRSAL